MIGVLVVDDDFMVARIHARFVEQADDVEPVGLLDVHLPDFSGLDVLERLRGAGNQVAVVMVTAERGAEAVRAALHGGALQYLVKPFGAADLVDRLRRVSLTLGLLAGGDTDQELIDAAFGTSPTDPGRGARPGPTLPKGLSPETAGLVLAAMRDRPEISASEAGEAVGLSRVTARRYLEHFVDTAQAEVRLQYGSAGRPERRYRARAGA